MTAGQSLPPAGSKPAVYVQGKPGALPMLAEPMDTDLGQPPRWENWALTLSTGFGVNAVMLCLNDGDTYPDHVYQGGRELTDPETVDYFHADEAARTGVQDPAVSR